MARHSCVFLSAAIFAISAAKSSPACSEAEKGPVLERKRVVVDIAPSNGVKHIRPNGPVTFLAYGLGFRPEAGRGGGKAVHRSPSDNLYLRA